MERFSLAGGQGWLTVEESGGRARCAAELPEDGKGLYKGYLCGTGGRALLGTFLPEDGRLKLRRTLSLDELRRQGPGRQQAPGRSWPFPRARPAVRIPRRAGTGRRRRPGEWGNPCWPGRLAGGGRCTGRNRRGFPWRFPMRRRGRFR